MKSMIHFLCFAFIVTALSCQKPSVQTERKKSIPDVSQLTGMIAKAKAYFEADLFNSGITYAGASNSNARQLLQKVPLWEKAYIGDVRSFNIVVVPLKFPKNYIIKNDDIPSHNLSLEKQTKLLLYESPTGFHTYLVTTLPDAEFIDHPSSPFSGVIIVEDWAGNNIHRYAYKNGKIYNLSVTSPETGKEEVNYCYYINHYLCSVDENGDPYDCEYEYTEWLGCQEEERHDQLWNEFGGAGTDFSIDEMQVSKTIDWNVASNPVNGVGEIKSLETIRGKKDASETQGGHFVSIAHNSSICNFCSISNPYDIWTENSNSVSVVSAQSASASTAGQLNYGGNTYRLSNSTSWAFSDIF